MPARRLSSALWWSNGPPTRRRVDPVQADFGPLRLVEASTPATAVSPGDEIPLSLLWQAAPDYQPEPLVVVVQLLDEDGQVVASLEEEPLAGRYPTTAWQAGELVQDRHTLVVPARHSARQVPTHRRSVSGSGRTTTRSSCGSTGPAKQRSLPYQGSHRTIEGFVKDNVTDQLDRTFA